jgi:hypothetical protein
MLMPLNVKISRYRIDIDLCRWCQLGNYEYISKLFAAGALGQVDVVFAISEGKA